MVPQSEDKLRLPRRRGTLLFLLLFLTACGGYPVVDLPSVNHSSRVDYLVLHFTSEDYAESVRLLTTRTDNPVSAHYLVPLDGDRDPTYSRRKAVVHRLVAEERRAWHAGRSYWAGEESLNGRSIGIEIVNLSKCEMPEDETVYAPAAEACQFLHFPEEQIALLVPLLQDLLERYPGIDPVDIVGHADVAPSRKFDPGPLFPWKALHDAGIGAWPDEDAVSRWRSRHANDMPAMSHLQLALNAYGYDVEATGEEDLRTREALRAFQMHFLPARVSGSFDLDTVATLFALLEKYRPEALAELSGSQHPS